MNFCQQIRLLLWKMLVMKKRRLFGTLLEIFLPVLLTSILILIRDEVEITNEPVTYGESVPIFSIFDVDGLPVSLPGTIDAQDICLGNKINKFIAVTPNDDNTRWFLSHLEEYYHYVSNQTLLDYYDWNYFASNVDNFRDLIIVVNNTLDLCVDFGNNTCDSFIELLNDAVGLDIYNDEQLEQIIAVINITISTSPEDIQDFLDFLQDIEFGDFNQTIEFNVTDPDEIAELLEFVKFI